MIHSAVELHNISHSTKIEDCWGGNAKHCSERIVCWLEMENDKSLARENVALTEGCHKMERAHAKWHSAHWNDCEFIMIKMLNLSCIIIFVVSCHQSPHVTYSTA